MWGESDGPYTLKVDGEYALNRYDQPRTESNIMRVKLSVCESCNGILNQRFETRAKKPVRSLKANGETDLTAAEAVAVGEWLVKTWLLLGHPRAVYPNPVFDGLRWADRDDDLYSWTVSQAPPPAGLSVWASKIREPQPDDPDPQVLLLPTVVADGGEIEFEVFPLYLGDISVTLLYHPGWAIEHPREKQGGAVRMWPRYDREPEDFSVRSRVASGDPKWCPGWRLTFADGTYEPAAMPPLSPALDFFDCRLPGDPMVQCP